MAKPIPSRRLTPVTSAVRSRSVVSIASSHAQRSLLSPRTGAAGRPVLPWKAEQQSTVERRDSSNLPEGAGRAVLPSRAIQVFLVPSPAETFEASVATDGVIRGGAVAHC